MLGILPTALYNAAKPKKVQESALEKASYANALSGLNKDMGRLATLNPLMRESLSHDNSHILASAARQPVMQQLRDEIPKARNAYGVIDTLTRARDARSKAVSKAQAAGMANMINRKLGYVAAGRNLGQNALSSSLGLSNQLNSLAIQDQNARTQDLNGTLAGLAHAGSSYMVYKDSQK